MKKFIAFIAAICMAVPAIAAPPKKGDKDKSKKKEPAPVTWIVVIEGATNETAGEEVKAFLTGMKDVKVEECAKKDNTVEAVISSKNHITRGDISKAIKERKELKVKEFKVKKEEKPAKTDPKKPDSKLEPKKPETKPADTKPETKPADAKPEPKKEMKKDEKPAAKP